MVEDQAFAQSHNCPDNREALVARGEVFNEGAVDFDFVEWEASEVAERGVAGSKIIHGNSDAEPAQLKQDCEILLSLLHQYRFRHLRFEAIRRKTEDAMAETTAGTSLGLRN